MIRIKCPNAKCAKELGIDESKAGGVGACPNCGTKFRIPSAAKIAAKAQQAKPAAPKPPPAPPGSANANRKPWQSEDDFNPYAIKQETEEKGPPEDDRVDQMVRDDFRNKKREKAWKEVGLPTTLMKVLSLIAVGLSLLIFVLASIDVVLYNFKLEQMANPPPGEPKVDPPEMFFADFFGSAPGEAPAMLNWLIWFGILIVELVIFGTILAGAEAMKKLENYKLSMVACILSIVFGGMLLTIGGVLGLMALLNDKVKLQFPEFKKQREEKEEEEWAEMEERKRRLREGLPLDDDEDEDAEDEPEEEADVRPRKGKKKKRRKAAQSGGMSPMLISGICLGVLTLLLAVGSIFFPPVALALSGIGFVLYFVSYVWLLIIAFQDEILHGILILFFGPYALIYAIMHWEECKTPTIVFVLSIVMVILGFAFLFVGAAANAPGQ